MELAGLSRATRSDRLESVQAVATHIHFDHSGGLHQFEKFSIHSLEAEAIRQGDNFVTSTLFFSASEIAVPPVPRMENIGLQGQGGGTV